MAKVTRGRPPKEKVIEQPTEQIEGVKEVATQPVAKEPVAKSKAQPVIKVLPTRATPRLSTASKAQPSGNVLVYDKLTGKSVSMSHGYAQQFVKRHKNCVIKS